MKTLSRKQFNDLFYQVQKSWEYSEPIQIYFPSKKVVDLDGIGAMVFSPSRNKVPWRVMVVNSIILTFPINEILDIIYHELAHFITNAGDNEWEFQIFCKLNDIPMNQERSE
jgi:hypothetical protein